jgi:hypothetical protein
MEPRFFWRDLLDVDGNPPVAMANGFAIEELFEEVETGKGADALERRPKLAEAIRRAHKVKGPIVVAS